VAVRNANDGISMTQTAEGSLSAIQDSLQRIRELTVQAGNDTNGSADRTSMQNEVDALVKEIDRVVGVTSFNGQSLLDGTFKTGKEAVIQVGTGDTSNDQIKIAIADYKTTTLKVDALKLDTAANAQKALTAITTAINTVSDGRAALGTNQNQLSAAITNLSNTSVSLQASRSRIMDTDYATETTNLAKTQIIQQAATAMLAQANQSSQSVLALLK
jgi:flagellin